MSSIASSEQDYLFEGYSSDDPDFVKDEADDAVEGDTSRNVMTCCRFVTFLALLFPLGALIYQLLQWFFNIDLIFQGDDKGKEDLMTLAAVCAAISGSAFLTWMLSGLVGHAMSVQSYVDEGMEWFPKCGDMGGNSSCCRCFATWYDPCRRLLVLLGFIFFTCFAGIIFAWAAFVTEVGLQNPNFWAGIFAFGWAALGLFIGSCCARCWCILYTMFFLCNFLTWPIVCRFTIVAPKAQELWYLDYDPFPVNDPTFQRQYPLGDVKRSVSLSPIPDSPQGCNFSCIGTPNVATAEMNFPVEMSINAPEYFADDYNTHVMYPVLLMSADFENWHVAADRRDALPQSFFRDTTASTGLSFRSVVPSTLTLVETTTSTPVPITGRPGMNAAELVAALKASNAARRLLGDDAKNQDSAVDPAPAPRRRLETTFTTTTTGTPPPPPPIVEADSFWMRPNQGMYVVACVVTDQEKLKKSRDSVKDDLLGEESYTDDELLAMCSSVGGVCGYPCNQNYDKEVPLPKCTSTGKIDLTKAFPKLKNNVKVDIKSCLPGTASDTTAQPGSISAGRPGNCQSSTAPFSSWTCPARGLPAMEVTAKNVAHESTQAIRPQTFMFAAKASDFDTPGDAVKKWQRYNRFTIMTGYQKSDEFYYGYPMTSIKDNSVQILPDKCYTRAGPLYMVACAINASSYDQIGGGTRAWKGKFQLGQKVAPPPFNDRCVAVAGRCGLACQSSDRTTGADSPLIGPYCSQDGTIPQHLLVGEVPIQRNDHFLVKVMVFILLLGYFQRVLSALPGLFFPFPQARYYRPEMTKHYKYITACCPSAGEDKMCCLRNLIGVTSAYPSECHCPYHVVFLDEVHRHGFKGMLKAFMDVMNHVLDKTKDTATDTGNFKGRDTYNKFMADWVKQTRGLRLEDETQEYCENYLRMRPQEYCETGKLSKKNRDKLMDAITGWSAYQTHFPGKEKPEVFTALEKEINIGFEDIGEADGKKGTKFNDLRDDSEDSKKKWKELVNKTTYKNVVLVPKNTSDDIEEFPLSARNHNESACKTLYMHYVARGKTKADSAQILDAQHVTVGMAYYQIPTSPVHECPSYPVGYPETGVSTKENSYWLKMRQKTKVMQAHETDGEDSQHHFNVPQVTSRGKAGGLNFAANYLYNWHLWKGHGDHSGNSERPGEPDYLPSLFGIADIRHQFQAAFMTSCIPYFFKPGEKKLERDAQVAFTQVPQFFEDERTVDEKDFLDNNNAMYFRINGTIRNCCGGASSCGANGMWQLNDPRDDHAQYGLEKHYFTEDFYPLDTVPDAWDPDWAEGYTWEIEANPHVDTEDEIQENLGPRKQIKERSIFHESCKIEDTASSLCAVLRGQRSQYVNMRLSYAMTKSPISYLAAVQRWAEGAVVLMLQTYIDMPIHTKSPCLSKFANMLVLLAAPAFILWTMFYVYGYNWDPWLLLEPLIAMFPDALHFLGPLNNYVFNPETGLLADFGTFTIVDSMAPAFTAHVRELFLMPFSLYTWWIAGILWALFLVFVIPTCLYGVCWSCCQMSKKTTPVWPHELSAWARLAIIMDNLTYWLFFFTAFWWIFFNAYTAFSEFIVSYSTKFFYLGLIVLTSLFHYAQLVVSMVRAQNIQRDEGNAVLSVKIDNIWRQTQLYYINAPLQLIAIVYGIIDYLKQTSFGNDLSFWVGGDRGDFTSNVVKCWLLTIIIIAISAVLWQFVRPDPNPTSIVACLVLCLTASDVLFPCVYLFCEKAPGQYKKLAKDKYNQWKRDDDFDDDDDETKALTQTERKSRDKGGVMGCMYECLHCGQDEENLPLWMRFVTCVWWQKTLYLTFCQNSCVIALLKYVGVVKEFLVPVGVGIAIFAQGGSAANDEGSGVIIQLVAAGFTGAH